MSDQLADWSSKGFARAPRLLYSPAGGLLLYRCWGARRLGVGSGEWGSGFFGFEKPTSVIDAEMRFHIGVHDNGIHFISTFRLKPGIAYWRGPIHHKQGEVHTDGDQAYIEEPLKVKLELVTSKVPLNHDAFMSPVDGHAGPRSG